MSAGADDAARAVASHPLYVRSDKQAAALIEAAGRVFAASLQRATGDPSERDRAAAASVGNFLDSIR